MNVIVLHREMQHAKRSAIGRRDGPVNRTSENGLAKRRQPLAGAQRDVEREARLVLRTHAMRHPRPPNPGSPGARTRAAPRPVKPQRKLPLGNHLNMGIVML